MAVSEDLEAKQENAHLKEIEEFVFDQDLVISYKKLSKLLNIHVNKAKRLLAVFVENANRGKRPISVTYVVSGEQASDLENKVNPWRVCVVPETKLEATKQLFLPDTMSVHVFSVHQGSEVQDNAMLLEASKCSGYSSGISAIRNKNAVPYDDEQMQQLMKKVQLTATVQVPIGFANKKPAPKPEVAKPVPKEPPAKKVEVKPEETKETEDSKNATKQTSGTISGMFAAQSSNKAAPSKPATSTSTATNNKKGGKKVAATSSITSFFQRQKDAPPKPPQQKKEEVVNTEPESEKSDDNAKESSSPEQKNTKSSPSQPEAVVTNGKGKGTSNSKASKAASKRPASKNQNKKKDDTAKRRKRIIALSDSESSDEEGRDEEMQVDSPPPPVSVEVEDEPPAVQEKPSEGIIKERRLVDKVYQDEKGFIVTKKEWVVETRKVEDLPEKETKKSPEKEKPAPVKRKQQSDIMSFFGRK